jgi:putative transposase
VRAFNERHGRTGTLWQGRFKSSLVDTDEYLLAVLRYIDLNPVRAAMVSAPEDFAWSSARVHLGLVRDPWLTPAEGYVALGRSPETSSTAYRALLSEAIAPETIVAIRRHVAQERAFSSERFCAMIEKALGRPASLRRRGRPATRSRDCE